MFCRRTHPRVVSLIFSLCSVVGGPLAALPDARAQALPTPQAPRLWIEHPRGSLADVVTDGKITLRPNFFGNFDLRDLVKDDAVALGLATQSTRYNSNAHWAYWAGVLPSFAVLTVSSVKENDPGIYISAGAALVALFLTGHFIALSRHYSFAAMNRYNGVPVAAPAPAVGFSF